MTRHFSKSTPRLPSLFDDLDLPPLPSEIVERAKSPTTHLPSSSVRPDIFFMSFGSGSSGNCAYVGDGRDGFLIDAGVDPDHVFESLRRNGIEPEQVRGICLTHDHGDHTRYVYTIVRRYRHIGVYCTPKAFNGIMRRHSISRRLRDYHRPIYKEFPFKIGAFEITAFEVSHDGTDNAGFFITRSDHTMAIATDLGCITDRVDHYMRQARYVMLETNYDAQMLRDGPYPAHLKARISDYNGHLDNVVAARFLADIYRPELRFAFLCHLSLDNNTPAKARNAVADALRAKVPGLTIGDGSETLPNREAALQLAVLPRHEASPLFRLPHP